jgi:SAM-dependent methyltransferase
MALGVKTALVRRFRDVAMRPAQRDRTTHREDLARRYLRGEGIEIGAFAWRLRVPPGAMVRYVDYAPKAELLAMYDTGFAQPEAVPETDVIDDATRLEAFADESLDFVVASHVVEHLEDPVSALRAMARVLRSGGILFLVLPDARSTFDAPRERTSIEHVMRDHHEGPAVSRGEHYEEWARHIEGATGEHVARRAREFASQDARHHFHVWELEGFIELLNAVDLPCDLELGARNHDEFVVVLRRTAPD